MKNIVLICLIFISLIFDYSSFGNNASIDTFHNVKSYYEPIDTVEFINYWKEFRNMILNHDTATLSSMVCDTLVGGCFFAGYEEYDLPKNLWGHNLYKPIFFSKIDSLFTSPYLMLLEEYDIEKDFYSENYYCNRTIGQKRYSTSVYIDQNNIFTYRMGYQIDIGLEICIDINLKFIKTVSGIKLYRIGCEESMFAPHYDAPCSA